MKNLFVSKLLTTLKNYALAFAVVFFTTTSAYAQCSNPAGAAGEMIYNGAFNTMQFCNGTQWISMAGGGCGGSTGGGGGTAFTNQTGVAVSTVVRSNNLFVTTTGTATCGAGCTGISRNGAAYVAGPVTGFVVGDTISIQQTSSATPGTTTTADVTLGSTTYTTWAVTTGNNTVNPFSFVNVTGATLGSTVTSNTVTLTGGFTTAAVNCGSGCTGISINGAAFVAGPVFGVKSGDTIAIRVTSSASASTAVNTTVAVGATTSGTWSVTTGIANNTQTFNSSSTWNKPAGFSAGAFAIVACVGGGGGGMSGSNGCSWGAGGGGGGSSNMAFALSYLPSSVSVTIGAGGLGGASEPTGNCLPNPGTNGGNSSFGSYLTGNGGARATGAAGAGGAAGPGGATGGSGGAAPSSVSNAPTIVPGINFSGFSSCPSYILGGGGSPQYYYTHGAQVGSCGAGASGGNSACPADCPTGQGLTGFPAGGGGGPGGCCSTDNWGGPGGAGRCIVTVVDGP